MIKAIVPQAKTNIRSICKTSSLHINHCELLTVVSKAPRPGNRNRLRNDGSGAHPVDSTAHVLHKSAECQSLDGRVRLGSDSLLMIHY